MSLLKRLPAFAQRSALSFGLRFGGLLLQFISAILIARVLGVAGYGVYTYAFSVAMVTSAFLGFGFVPLAVRELPRYLGLKDYAMVIGYLITGFWLIVGSGAVASVVIIVLNRYGVIVLGVNWKLVALMAVFQTLVLALSSTLNGFNRVLQSQLIETVVRQGLLVAVVYGLAFGGYAFTPTRLLVLSLGLVGLVLALQSWRIGQALAEQTRQRLPPAAYDMRRWLVVGMPLMGIGVLHQLQMNLDFLMIGALTDADSVGRYRAASRAADLVIIANGIALQLLEPMLSRALALDDKAGAQRMISHSVMTSVALAVALAVPLFFGATYYLQLFGSEFVPAAPVLRILVTGHLLGFLCGPVAVILVMMGRERIVLMATLGGLIVNFAISYIFVPRYGILAAATATVVSGVLVKVALLAVVVWSGPFDPTPGALFHRAFGRRRG